MQNEQARFDMFFCKKIVMVMTVLIANKIKDSKSDLEYSEMPKVSVAN